MAKEQTENYLKNIYKLQSHGGKVTTSSLSQQLKITPASVSEMVRRLAEEGYVTHAPYKGVQLTVEGRKKALRIIRRHRLWELFLVRILKYHWDEIDEEAERLEHITSDRLERRIDELLGFPDRDPHGDVIPTVEGKVVEGGRAPLSDVGEGKTVVVSRVSDSSPEILQYASKLGIALGKKIRVKDKVDFDGSLRVDVGGKERFISSKLAQNVFVEVD